MNAIESQEFVSDDTTQSSDNTKLVPVTESIRYRKRAQSAEKQLEDLSEQLVQTKSEAAKMSEQLNEVRLEQNLMRKLAAAGAVDLEAAVLIAKTRLDGDEASPDSVIEQLKKEKQYLFVGKETLAAKKTAGAKDRLQNSQTALEKAARKAATTGSRTDLQQYLKLRRNYL
jgi:uncharacterized coiled-coil protein SlyX